MDHFKPLYKQHRRAPQNEINNILDLNNYDELTENQVIKNGNVFTFKNLPGFKIIKNAISDSECKELIKESMEKYGASNQHLSNLDAHYKVERPIQMFGKNPSKLPNSDVLVRDKLRWFTLGGQYDWTRKVYPTFDIGQPGCPAFLESVAKQIALEYEVRPEAAIVNFYKQGDILSPHQDVAELTKTDLLSISLGCSCVFYAAKSRLDEEPLAVLLECGDMVVMGGESRDAFHGVGRIFANTCPDYIYDVYPTDTEFKQWMSCHRVNINIRQMIQ